MGKLHERPKTSTRRSKRASATKPQDDVFVIHRNPNPTREQVARSQAMQRFLDDKRRESAAMTPEEKKQADRDWQKFKKTINEGRYRKVILD